MTAVMGLNGDSFRQKIDALLTPPMQRDIFPRLARYCYLEYVCKVDAGQDDRAVVFF